MRKEEIKRKKEIERVSERVGGGEGKGKGKGMSAFLVEDLKFQLGNSSVNNDNSSASKYSNFLVALISFEKVKRRAKTKIWIPSLHLIHCPYRIRFLKTFYPCLVLFAQLIIREKESLLQSRLGYCLKILLRCFFLASIFNLRPAACSLSLRKVPTLIFFFFFFSLLLHSGFTTNANICRSIRTLLLFQTLYTFIILFFSNIPGEVDEE